MYEAVGAGCSLTWDKDNREKLVWTSLNAPDGAGCSLTQLEVLEVDDVVVVS